MGLMGRLKAAGSVLAKGTLPNPLASEPADPSQAALVKSLNDWCVSEREFWAPTFKRIREEQSFAAGKQWPKDYTPRLDDMHTEGYVGDVIQQMLNRKTSTLYAKNPTVEASVKPRLEFSVWDEEQATIDGARAILAQAAPIQAQAAALAQRGVPVPPEPPEVDHARLIVADYESGMARRAMLQRVSKTATLLIQNQWDSQTPSLLVSAKQLTTRILTSRVGYIKVMYRREMDANPSAEGVVNLADKLALVRSYLKRVSDPDFDPEGPESKQMELVVAEVQADLQNPDQAIVKTEGVVYDFPCATSVIIDRRCKSLREFTGARRIAHEVFYTVEQCEVKFGVSLRDTGARFYTDDGNPGQESQHKQAIVNNRGAQDKQDQTPKYVCVWDIEDRDTGLNYIVCDGVKDFLQPPEEREPILRRFWSIVPVVFNVQEVEFNDPESDCTIYPRSDVRLAMPMQIDINKGGEGLREHRTANRPCWIAVKSKFEPNDLVKLSSPRAAHTCLTMEGIQPGEKISDFIQALPTVAITPELYSPAGAMQAMMDATGVQAADLGQQRPDEKATGQQIAAQQKASSDGSNVDDIDTSLSTVGQMTFEMLIQEMPSATVKQLIGQGATWPDLTSERLAVLSEIFVAIAAGSSGRPNQGLEVQNFQLIAPQLGQLMQAEGLSLVPLVKEGVRRLGDKLEVDDFLQQSPMAMAAQQAAQAEAQQKGQPGKPNPPSISFKGPDLTPEERAQALAQDGIQATPGAGGPPAQPAAGVAGEQPQRPGPGHVPLPTNSTPGIPKGIQPAQPVHTAKNPARPV